MQDFTGVPAVVDLAAMRDAMKNLGGENPNSGFHIFFSKCAPISLRNSAQIFP